MSKKMNTNKPTVQECPFDHTPNEVTKKALEGVKARKGLKKAATVEALFEALRE